MKGVESFNPTVVPKNSNSNNKDGQIFQRPKS